MTSDAQDAPTAAQNGVQRRGCLGCSVSVRPDRYVCSECVKLARRHVRAYFDNGDDGRDLLDELDIAATKQARMTRKSGAKTDESPIPFNERAASIRDEDATWLVHVAQTLNGHIVDTRAAAAVIYRRLPTLVGDPVSGMLVTELRRRWVRATRVIDRPAEQWFAGRCTCGTDLYAAEGASVIECRACRRRYDVEAQRRALLDLVEERLATATEICRAVHLLDQPVTRSQIDNWVARGQLDRKGRDRKGHALYRVGDILTLVAVSARKRA